MGTAMPVTNFSRERWICVLLPLHTHTHPFNGPVSGTTRVSRTRKVKPIWILLKQETVSGSGISWAICKAAPRSRQITTPAPHSSVFTGRMPFMPPNQQRQSTEGITSITLSTKNLFAVYNLADWKCYLIYGNMKARWYSLIWWVCCVCCRMCCKASAYRHDIPVLLDLVLFVCNGVLADFWVKQYLGNCKKCYVYFATVEPITHTHTPI